MHTGTSRIATWTMTAFSELGRRRITCVLATLMLVATTGDAAAQARYGVFVGINDYIAFEDEPGGDLQGAETDALEMRDVLVELWGLPETNTRTLLSREATKEAIRSSIVDFLAREAGPDDVSVFYFAGHGAQAFDLDGDEPDGLDETLAPTDILRESTDHDIRDDELRAWLAEVPGQVVVILDSCHSGTATRAGGQMRARILGRDIPSEGGREPERVRQVFDPESMADGSAAVLEVAAAAPNQSAMEGAYPTVAGVEQRGAFTYHLVRGLRAARADATYAEVLDGVVAAMKADFLHQDPQASGPTDDAVFGSAAGAADAPQRKTPTGGILAGVSRATLHVDVTELGSDPFVEELGASLGPPGTDGRATSLVTGGSWRALSLRRTEGGDRIEVLGRDGVVRASVPAGAGIVERTRDALDKEFAYQALGVLTSPAPPFRVVVTAGGGRRHTLGEPLTAEVSSDRSGFLTLLRLAPDGALRVEAETSIAAGRPLRVVGAAPATSGLGLLFAVVTPQPLDLDPSRADAVEATPGFGLIVQLQDALDAVLFRDRGDGTWSSGLLAYEVGARATR